MTSPFTRHRESEAKLQALAAHIKAELPKGVVFMLVAATVGEGGFSSYVSNGDRDDMIKLMKEQIERFESNSVSGPLADPEEMSFRKSRHDRRREARSK